MDYNYRSKLRAAGIDYDVRKHNILLEDFEFIFSRKSGILMIVFVFVMQRSLGKFKYHSSSIEGNT
jgi:hypothetical protein